MTTIQLTSTNPKTITSATAETAIDISPDAGFSSEAPPNATFKIAIYGLDKGDEALIQFDDTVNSFTNWVTHASFTVVGPIGSTYNTNDTGGLEGAADAFWTNPKFITFRWGDVPAIRWGVSNALLRINVIVLTGSSPHMTYNAWIEF
jgi:hypothetical protein